MIAQAGRDTGPMGLGQFSKNQNHVLKIGAIAGTNLL
jgi:hypothetical protein